MSRSKLRTAPPPKLSASAGAASRSNGLEPEPGLNRAAPVSPVGLTRVPGETRRTDRDHRCGVLGARPTLAAARAVGMGEHPREFGAEQEDLRRVVFQYYDDH